MKNEKPTLFKEFHGTVDDVLNHCSKVDDTEINRVTDPNGNVTREEAIQMVMDDCKLSRKDAEWVVDEMQMEECKRIIGELITEGLVYIADYDGPDGEPRYLLTEKGKQHAEAVALAKTLGAGGTTPPTP